MTKIIGILNCYADEPFSAPSARLFSANISDAKIINHCHGEMINNISQYDGYIISGSRSCHKDNDSWITDIKEIIKQIYDKNIPCLAVCFGHQVVAHMFGGSTVKNQAGEDGFQDVPTKRAEGSVKLFAGLPNPVKVYQSHYDAVLKAPPESTQVISNDKCVQYYQYGSIISIQSHPEIDVEAAKRFVIRDNKDIKTVLNGVNEQNIQSQMILKNFYTIVENS